MHVYMFRGQTLTYISSTGIHFTAAALILLPFSSIFCLSAFLFVIFWVLFAMRARIYLFAGAYPILWVQKHIPSSRILFIRVCSHLKCDKIKYFWTCKSLTNANKCKQNFILCTFRAGSFFKRTLHITHSRTYLYVCLILHILIHA